MKMGITFTLVNKQHLIRAVHHGSIYLGQYIIIPRRREALSRGSDCDAVWFWPSAYEDTFYG